MKNKEIQEKIDNYKPKYLYQRYDGRIIKYEISGENLINTEIGMCVNREHHILLGKTSEKLKDLIEIGDLVKIEDNWGQIHWFEVYENSGIYQYEILEIVTKEMMESISYKVTKM